MQTQTRNAVKNEARAVISPKTGHFQASLLKTLRVVKKGDFSVRLKTPARGIHADIAKNLNGIIQLNENLAKELERLSRVVGKEGRLGERASLGTVSGSWAHGVTSINSLIGDLVQPIAAVEAVIGAVARGELSRKMPTTLEGRPLKGAFANIADTINTMVDQLNGFASEVRPL